MNEKANQSRKSLLSGISSINPKNIEVVLKRKIRWIIMILFFIINMIMMMDTGLFSSATAKIKETLNVDNQTYGLFGSCNFSGRIIGTLLFMAIFNIFNRKYLILIPLYVNTFSIFLFTITNIVSILYIARVLSGISSTFGFIYFPIWIDQFGIQSKKTIMMSLIQMASPLGMVLGYTLNTILGSEKWKFSLLIESILLFIFITTLFFIPKKYFSQKLFFKYHFDGLNKVRKVVKNKFNKLNKKGKSNNPKENSSNKNKQINISRPSIFTESQGEKKGDIFSLLKKLEFILSNKLFIATILYKSSNQFICAGIGFWLTDYLENCIGITSSFTKLYSYIIIIVAGPISGMILGGFIGSLTGGYEKKQSVLTICIFQLVSAGIGFLVPTTNNVKFFVLFLSLFNAFMSATVPINTGLILWTMPKNLKGFGNGIGNLITTFIGKLPAPFIYGLLQQKFSNIYKKMGMLVLMSFGTVGEICLIIATIIRYKDKSTELKKQMEESKIHQSYKEEENIRNTINRNTISTIFNNDVVDPRDEYLNDNNNSGSDENDNSEELETIYGYYSDSQSQDIEAESTA